MPVYWRQPQAAADQNGCLDAACDRSVVRAWWDRWPAALIGFATGRDDPAIVVLDIDVKGAVNGFDPLAALGHAVLPVTPMAHTPSGGLHLYFAAPDHVEIRNTSGARGRGIGPGLDWRGAGGYVIVPSPGSGYRWDEHCNLRTVPFAAVPANLVPRQPPRGVNGKPARPTAGLSPYGEAALDSATARILRAPCGEQKATVNAEAFAIGTLAAAGGLPPDFARRVIKWAAVRLRSYDSRRPWSTAELETKVDRAFDAGLRQPRRARL